MNEDKIYNTSYNRILLFVFQIFFGAMLLFWLVGQIKYHKVAEEVSLSLLTERWTYETEMGSRGETSEYPVDLGLEDEGLITFSTVLPQKLPVDAVLSFLTYRSFYIYVDDELIYSMDSFAVPFGIHLDMSLVHTIPLDESAAGKTLSIVRPYEGGWGYELRPVYLSSRYELYRYYISRYGIQFFAAIFLVIIAVIFLMSGFVLRVVYHYSRSLINMGCALLLAGVWIITDSWIYPLMFHNSVIHGAVSYIAVMLLPFPILRDLDEEFKYRYHKLYIVLETITLGYTAIFAFLDFAKIIAFTETRITMNVLLAAVIICIVITIIIDILRGYAREYIFLVVGMAGLATFGMVEIYMVNNPINPNEGLFLVLGLFVLMGCSVLNVLHQMHRNEQITMKAVLENRRKSEFLANMSHEIRMPMNAIIGMDEMILRESDNPAILGYATNIKSAGKNLLNLINDILDLSKIESGKMELANDEYSLADLLRNLVNITRPRAEGKGLAFTITADENLPKGLRGDEHRFEQVLINIVGNAIKYTEEGGVTVRISGEMQEGPKLLLSIEVKDTGIGIKDEDKEKLFHSFERLDRKRNKDVEGTGLGLAITYQLVSLMGGSIDFDSNYGEGSTFTIQLAQDVVGEEVLGSNYMEYNAEEMQTAKNTFTVPNARFLIVDDNEINLMVASSLLARLRPMVDTAFSGEEALKLMQERRYDLIFLDHMMPGMDGVETLKEAKKLEKNLCKDTPVVILTANALKDIQEEYYAAGFDAYLSKPIDVDALEKMVYQLLPKEKIVE